MSEINQSVLSNSVVLIGPAGVGKTTIANALGKAKNLPVVHMDLLRHCPESLAEIEKRKSELEASLAYAKETIEAGKLERMSGEFANELKHIKNELWICEEQLRMRKMFPHVLNYKSMGFRDGVSMYLEKNFGKVAWHFYQKQFETALLQSVMEQATEPCIFDLGGGMAVSLDAEYKKLAEKFINYDKNCKSNLFKENFNTNKIGFKHIKNVLEQFSHVVSLELPEDYASRNSRASKDDLNPLYIASGQYTELAIDHGHNINVGELVLSGGGINEDRLDEIVNTIKYLSPTKIFRK